MSTDTAIHATDSPLGLIERNVQDRAKSMALDVDGLNRTWTRCQNSRCTRPAEAGRPTFDPYLDRDLAVRDSDSWTIKDQVCS